MNTVRRPLAALITMVVLVIVQGIADPTGLLALVGWSGASLRYDLGTWPLAPYIVFVPVLLAMTWWVTARAGERFWTHTLGLTLAVLLAQAATAFFMAYDLATAGWAAGYVAAKAVPAALIVAAFTRWFGGERHLSTNRVGSGWIPAALLAALAPLLAGLWWTGPVYGPGVPTARVDSGVLSVVITVALLALAAWWSLRIIRPRVPGVLGGWLAAVLAGALVGVVQALVIAVVDGGFAGDIWPLMAAYVTVADGMAFGASVGWIIGIAAAVNDRYFTKQPEMAVTGPIIAGDAEAAPTKRSAAATVTTVAAIAVVGIVASFGLAAGGAANATSGAAVPAEQDMAAPAGILRADGSTIVDGNGNQVLLRGTNVNQLVDFFAAQPDVPVVRPLTEQDYADMASYGFNVVRLNISWSALEPERGSLDPGYLGKIRQAVAWGKQHGIYTVIDMHQDGWWNKGSDENTVCRPGTEPMWGYDGAPDWATITDRAPRCQFTGRDISPAGDRAFQHFYFDTDGVQTALAETWGRLAAEFKNEPMVAGFDLLNEPGFGETAPVTTAHQLGKFYGKAIDEIRASGASQIVFVEPSILWSGLGFDSGPTPGFTTDTNIVYSPHLYAESITMDRDLGMPPIVSTERQFTLALRGAAAYDAPLWSGEYGYWGSEEVHWGEDADTLERMSRYAVAEDSHLLGSAYWVWKQACGDPQNGIGPYGNALMMQDCEADRTGDAVLPPKKGLLAILSRAYPQVAPGTLTKLSAQGANMTLEASTSEPSCDLTVWVPGTSKPTVDATGVTDVAVGRVSGGWIVTGCVDGEYLLSTKA